MRLCPSFCPPSPALLVAGAALLILLVIWFGYPLLIRLWSMQRTPSSIPRERSGTPSVSVLIATREDPVILQRRVADVLEGLDGCAATEVIVAADACCSDATVEGYRSGDPRVIVVRGDAPGGKAAALNAGMRRAAGDIVVFADSQQRFDSGAIGLLADRVAAGPYAAISGRLLLPNKPGNDSASPLRSYWQLESKLRADESAVHSAIGVTGCIWALRRDCWAPLPVGILNDDVYTPMRLVLEGHRVGYEGGAIARDLRAPDRATEFRRKVRTLAGNIQVCRALPGVLHPLRNPVWFQFVMHKLARYLTPVLTAIGAGALLVWFWELSMAPLVRLALLGGAGVLVLAVPGLRRRAAWLWQMHAAIVVGTYRGLRGSWDVWSPS